jgi:hypothetical protein
VECFDSGIGSFLGLHGDKSETARAATEFIFDDIDLRHRAMRAEQVAELLLRGIEREVSYKQFCTHDAFAYRFTGLSKLFPTVGSQIITEPGSTEDLPGFEIGGLSNWADISAQPRGGNY